MVNFPNFMATWVVRPKFFDQVFFLNKGTEHIKFYSNWEMKMGYT